MTLEEIKRLLQDRISEGSKENREFYLGNHWLEDGKGFPAMPPVGIENRAAIVAKIKEAFAFENIIGEAVERNSDGVTNREPDWDLVDLTETEANEKTREEAITAIVEYWNDRKLLETVKEALELSLLQDKAIVRAFIPKGYLSDSGGIEKPATLREAMEILQFEVLTADKAGVFLETNKYKPFGVFLSQDDQNNEVAEVTYLDEENKTRLVKIEKNTTAQFAQENFKTLSLYLDEETLSASEDQVDPIDLQGQLLIFEMNRKSIIDESVRSLQKQVNLCWTMSGKNTFLAGSRERYFTNAQKPVKETKVVDGNTTKIVREDATLNVGGSSTTFLGGAPIYSGEGVEKKVIGYANANVIIVDPVSAETFHAQRDKLKSAILDRVGQAHVGMNDTATASGKSRKEARSEFEKTLKKSKLAVDSLGRWILEVTLRFAADIMNQSEQFKDFRFDFNSIVDAGATDTEETTQAATDVEEGRLSLQTYLSKYRGLEDSDAEIERLEQSEMHELALQEKRFTVAQLAKDLGLPASEYVKVLGFEDEAEATRLAGLIEAMPEPPTSAPLELTE